MTEILVWNGAVEATGDLTVWNGQVERSPLSLGVMPCGYKSLSEMLQQSPFMVAHRGGSGSWPEHSLYAYTQSVAYGMPALEISVNRTSDNVLFCLHDSTLDRTSTNATNVNPKNITWEELSSNYKIDMNGKHEPYCRLEEVMDAYADTHVLFIDPKTLWTEAELNLFYSFIKTYSKPENFVIKFAGNGSSGPIRAAAEGFKTWGFFYNTDGETAIRNYQPYFDYLGLNYDAEQSYWNIMASFNKPVLGHITNSANAYQMVLNKGSSISQLGVMMANVRSVLTEPKVFENIEPIKRGTLLSDNLLPLDTLLLQEYNSGGEEPVSVVPSDSLVLKNSLLLRG